MGCDEGEPLEEKRQLLLEEFAAVASCDASVAGRYLAENNWEMEVRALFLLRCCPGAARAREAHVCVSFSEGAERLLRAAGGGGGGRLKTPPRVRARVLVSGTGSVGWTGQCGRGRPGPVGAGGRC